MKSPSEVIMELAAHRSRLQNLVAGKWVDGVGYRTLVNPLTGERLLEYPDTSVDDMDPFLAGLRSCPKSGLHNPFKNVGRYVMLGQVSFRAAAFLDDEEIADYFAKLVQSVMPKSYKQAMGEVVVVRQFLKNFGGDRVRFLARGTIDPGDHEGQQPQHFPWPYGPVMIIPPFNFPLEIPGLQLMGALYMGNRPLVKAQSKTGVVIEQFIRLLEICGLSLSDLDLIHCGGATMERLIHFARNDVRLVQFTGSSTTAEKLAQMLHGKIRIEDAGFDWKIIGPDVLLEQLDHLAWQCDQDAYAASKQKCSAQSLLFLPDNLDGSVERFYERLRDRASRRNLADLTNGPVLTWTTDQMLDHVKRLLDIPGAKLLFGGEPLVGHRIPKCYGAIQPTAVFVPLHEIVANSDHCKLATTEVFGPVQVITTYDQSNLALVLQVCEHMENHLTAAVVSNDSVFTNHILGATVNGTTYAGIKARTTGAPQNHWFGPCGDPRGAGIGTPEAIILTWSAPRCIIRDVGPIDTSATLIQS